MRIAVTGASGFIGSALLPSLRAAGEDAIGIGRNPAMDALQGADTLVHLAGLADRSATPEAVVAANHDHAVKTALRAREAGIRRLVLVSTIYVVAGHRGTVLAPGLEPRPLSAYGAAKARAETDLLGMEGLEVVVLRPPLVFGPGAKGNLAALMRLCASGAPLPFRSVHNRRSMVGVSNLCDALHFLATSEAPAVSGRIFHVAEDKPFSLARLVADSRAAMGQPPRLLSAPPGLLRSGLSLVGRGHLASQLFDDLIVDDRSLRHAGWTPKQTADDDLADMARAWR